MSTRRGRGGLCVWWGWYVDYEWGMERRRALFRLVYSVRWFCVEYVLEILLEEGRKGRGFFGFGGVFAGCAIGWREEGRKGLLGGWMMVGGG